MVDLPPLSNEASSAADGRVGGALPPEHEPRAAVINAGESDEVIPVLEETLTVSKRRRVTGGVRIATRTEVVEAIAEVELERYRVEVTRVPVGCVVTDAPAARAEGDTTIVPVVEERFVVVNQLFGSGSV